MPRVANPDDLVVLFLSTHGSGAELDVGGQNYLVAYDTDVSDLYTTGIPMQRLAHDIKDRVHCDRVVIFLDACHSGATEAGGKGLVRTGVDANEFAVGSGQLVIASSKEDQVSWESKKLPNGVFTASLLDALRSNGKTTTIDKTFATLKDRVQDTVLRERGILQTPVMSSQWKGKSILLTAEPVARHPGLEEEPTPVSEPPQPAGTDVSGNFKSASDRDNCYDAWSGNDRVTAHFAGQSKKPYRSRRFSRENAHWHDESRGSTNARQTHIDRART